MSLKKKWDSILQISVGLASLLAFSICSLVLLLVVGTAVVIGKILVFIK